MRLGVMLALPPEKNRQNCQFCKAEAEDNIRCANCNKFLAVLLSWPYKIICPRCKTVRKRGTLPQHRFKSPGDH